MKEYRKLAAIMFTDIVGYTALMSKNEQNALRILQKNRDLLKSLIEQYNGEWLQAIGDGTLSSFASVVDAVNCGLEVQRSLKNDPELNLRIGIHIGDVVIGKGEIYGDGVNVASRLESLADPGGICISGKVYSEIRNKPDIEAVFLGEKTLKNVDFPIKVYALIGEGLPAAMAKPYPAAERPAVARPKPARKRAYIYVGTAALVAVLVVTGYLLWRGVGEPTVPRFTNAIPVTTTIGVEDYPTWSPEGGRLAYESNQSGNWDIWVRQVEGGRPVNLTADYSGSDRCPSWSPDGNQIAFYSERDGGGYFVIPASGGITRKVVVAPAGPIVPWPSPPRWSPDGTELACIAWDISMLKKGLYLEIVNLPNTTSRRFPFPGPHLWKFDLSWSSDGRYFAYIDALHIDTDVSQLWVLRLADGKGFPITGGKANDWSPNWSRDGQSLYFVSNRRGGSMDLWRQLLEEDCTPRGEPQPVTSGLELRRAAFSSDRSRVAFSKGRRVGNIWRVPILEDRPATWADAKQLTYEQAFIGQVDVSPDMRRLLFDLERGGIRGLWVMDLEGGEMQQLTSGRPREHVCAKWSPDGKQIVYHSPEVAGTNIWVLPVEGGKARQLTQREGWDGNPTWSPDGREIAFVSDRSGNVDIWVIPAQGGEARQVTDHSSEDLLPHWSPDGQWLLFLSNRTRDLRLWRVQAAGGTPEPVTEGNIEWAAVWSKDGKKIYFNAYREDAWSFWEVPAEGGDERLVTDLAGKRGDFFQALSLATDGEYLYFTWSEDIGDLWVMDVAKNE